MDNFLIFKLLDSYYFDLVSPILCRIMDKVYTYYVERHFSIQFYIRRSKFCSLIFFFAEYCFLHNSLSTDT